MPLPLIPIILVAGSGLFAARKVRDAVSDHDDRNGYCSHCGNSSTNLMRSSVNRSPSMTASRRQEAPARRFAGCCMCQPSTTALLTRRLADPLVRDAFEPARAFLDAATKLAKQHDLAGQLVVASPLLGAAAGRLGTIASLDAMLGAVKEQLRSSSETRASVATLVFAVLTTEDARLVRLAAEKHGLVMSSR